MAKLKIELNTDDYKTKNELYESIIRGLREAIEMNNAANEKKSKRWKPMDYEEYYFIDSGANIMISSWKNCPIDDKRFVSRNVFKTEEEAQFEAERRKVIAELENFAEENNDEIDWSDLYKTKYKISYDHDEDKLYGSGNTYIQCCNSIYFSSENLCRQAIETVGEDRIKKYLFNVEE